jgi:hypothetical protein
MFILFALIFASSNSFASQMTAYGLGAINQSLANSTTSLPTDAYSQVYNPALMTYQEGNMFSFSVQGALTSFEKINQVLTDTQNLGASTPTVISDVNTRTPDTFNMIIATKVVLKKNDHPWNFGIYLNTPIEKMYGLETEDSFVPQYSMYLSDTQRLNAGINTSFGFPSGFSLGFGAQLYMVTAANMILRFPAGGNSTARVKADVRPGLAPVVGMTQAIDDHWKISATYVGQQDGRSQIDSNSYISILPSPTPLTFTAKTTIAFDPETYVIATSYQDDVTAFSASVNFENWSRYNGSVVALNFQSFNGSFSQNLPQYYFSNTISTHLGYEKKWNSIIGRVGYAFVPTPVPNQDGDSNFIDSDKHEVGLGIGLPKIARWLAGDKASLDIAALVHYLTPKTVVKNSSTSIGYPGYKIGGTVWSYGLTLTTEL